MLSLLLAVIYIAFISLGLPDSLLGAAWPSIYPELAVPMSAAGVLSMIIAGGTILSSLASGRMIRRFRTGPVTAVSVALTAAALLGFSVSGSFWQLCLWCIPYGLGAGSVDAALNNFVALHYKSRHMSWLHCFWGVGASVGPYIMGFCLTRGMGWTGGYRVIGILQVVLVAGLLLTLPLWKKAGEESGQNEQPQAKAAGHPLALPGAVPALLTFFCYCALESTTGLWAASYLVLFLGLDVNTAASFASLFYLGITAGRFAAGFITDRLGDGRMARAGQLAVIAGAACVLVFPARAGALAGLLLIGIGCAPIYPSLLHATPKHFGSEQSQAMMGLQMASAYTGTTLMPPLFGLLAQYLGVRLFPVYLLALAVTMLLLTVRMERAVHRRQA